MLSPFLVSLQKPSIFSPPPAHQPTHSCFLALAFPFMGHRAFIGPIASPPLDDRLGHSLLHMQLDPWVSPCVLFGWWFSP